MPDCDDFFDPIIADFDEGTTERNRLGANRHAAEIGVEIDAGKDFAGTGAQRGADFLPVVAVALLDRRRRRRDQLLVGFAQCRRPFHLASSFKPSRISVLTSAPSPALRTAAAMAAAACGWP